MLDTNCALKSIANSSKDPIDLGRRPQYRDKASHVEHSERRKKYPGQGIVLVIHLTKEV